LYLSSVTMAGADVAALARAVPHLRKCSFLQCGPPPLAGLRHAQQLRELHISSAAELTEHEVIALGLAEVRSLRVLLLTHRRPGAKQQRAAVAQLLRSPTFAHLHSFVLDGSG